jgi:DNA-binding response OmpR family regulator
MKKILIADDQVQISKILNDLFTNNGYKIFLAMNGVTAVEKTIEHRPDLIIMDIMMPLSSGFQAAEKIRNHPELSGTPIIFLTAKGLESDRLEAEKLGALAFFTKPFSPKLLLQEVEAHFNKLYPTKNEES